MSRISGTILAGGASRRFGGFTKSNMEIDGKTIISRIMYTIKDLFDEIIIVTNTPEEFEEYKNYKITGDIILGSGPLGGIHAGLNASSNEAIFVLAGDMPLLSRRLITGQIDYYNKNRCDILIPLMAEEIEPLHAVYNVSLIRKIEKYLNENEDYAIRKFIKGQDVCYMPLDASMENKIAFTNVNSPEDISVVEKILKRG